MEEKLFQQVEIIIEFMAMKYNIDTDYMWVFIANELVWSAGNEINRERT